MNEQAIDDLADTLIGTCLTLDEALSMRGLTDIDHDKLEAALELHNCQRCAQCGWWYEISDLDGKQECGECSAG